MTSSQQGILAVIAHPDDEFMSAGILNRFNRKGTRTTLICLTCGGRIRNAHLVNGTDAAIVRADEIRESCRVMGGTELILVDAPDGKSSEWNREKILSVIVSEIKSRSPSMVLASHKSVSSTHPDHLAAHELATRAFFQVLEGGTVGAGHRAPIALCYGCGFSPSRIRGIISKLPTENEKAQRLLRIVSLLPNEKDVIEIELNDDEYQAKVSVVDCHQSQFPDENGLYYGFPLELLRKLSRYEAYTIAFPENYSRADSVAQFT